MKLGIVISQNDPETVWNAFRLANLALYKSNTVSIFLTGKGVEYEQLSSSKFNIKEQAGKFLGSGGEITACGTCMAIRKKKSDKECPAGGIEDLYNLIADSDKVITF
ncbi:sulfur reduction protein DsrE [Candidatus Microgenomates bacterium]|nr:MAG: sulfur reduction protein DsrE [Candidatus Microgenomates bacterium]